MVGEDREKNRPVSIEREMLSIKQFPDLTLPSRTMTSRR